MLWKRNLSSTSFTLWAEKEGNTELNNIESWWTSPITAIPIVFFAISSIETNFVRIICSARFMKLLVKIIPLWSNHTVFVYFDSCLCILSNLGITFYVDWGFGSTRLLFLANIWTSKSLFCRVSPTANQLSILLSSVGGLHKLP